MPEFSKVGWNYYLTYPSTVQQNRLEALLQKEGIPYKKERGRVYTTRRPGLASDALRGMGVALHTVRKARNRPAMPAVPCRYGNGCDFSSADMDELADHLQNHYRGGYGLAASVPEEAGADDTENQAQDNGAERGQDMAGATKLGYQKGKFTGAELAELRRKLDAGMSEGEIARRMGRREVAVKKKARQLQASANGLAETQAPSGNGLAETQAPSGNGLAETQAPSANGPQRQIGPQNSPVTTSYTVIGLFRRAQVQASELQETLAQLTQVLGPWLEAQDQLLNRPANKDWR